MEWEKVLLASRTVEEQRPYYRFRDLEQLVQEEKKSLSGGKKKSDECLAPPV